MTVLRFQVKLPWETSVDRPREHTTVNDAITRNNEPKIHVPISWVYSMNLNQNLAFIFFAVIIEIGNLPSGYMRIFINDWLLNQYESQHMHGYRSKIWWVKESQLNK